MLQRTSLVAAFAVSGIFWTGAAQAQDVGIDLYAGYGAPYYYGPPVEYYYVPPLSPSNQYAPSARVERRTPGGSCGEFHYWTGSRCADARVTPPDID